MQSTISAILAKLVSKQVVVESVQKATQDATDKYQDSIFRLACALMEKMLYHEKQRYAIMQKTCPAIVRNVTFVQSYLHFATSI